MMKVFFFLMMGIFDTAYLYTGAPLSNDIKLINPLLSCAGPFFATRFRVGHSFICCSNFCSFANTYMDKCLLQNGIMLGAVYAPEKNIAWALLVKVWANNTLNSTTPAFL